MLLIYVQKITPRIRYVMQLYFGELIRTEFEITDDANRFQSFHGARLNYSQRPFHDECFVFAEDILFESGIHEQKISRGNRKGIPTLFSRQSSGAFPFDPFAAAFYLVTRYEEYLPFTPDQYGRFPDKENTGVKEGFHEVPVVNHFAMWLKEFLQQRYPELSFQNPSFEFRLTYDIDFAFAYRGKGFMRNAGGFAKSLLKLDLKESLWRMHVLRGMEADPYDTFDYQFALHEKFGLNPLYFFLLGDFNKFDKNIPWTNPRLQSLIRSISNRYDCGLHSSYASNSYSGKVKTELQRLESISGKKIIRNRQHFLKLKFPDTYQTLLANEITEDYTMGFASLTGFRSGIASPYPWYDLSKEETTSLRIFPFTVMDASLHYYLKLSPEHALTKTKSLMDEVKKVNGYFQFLAHNDLLSESTTWHGWRTGFAELLNHAAGLSKSR
ncbi:MAG: polysaccharide deacetylase family protein [Bacteroidetes bacterium]|nr:polysaccharide deacetylase family protein [Bacteroidota bacterium]